MKQSRIKVQLFAPLLLLFISAQNRPVYAQTALKEIRVGYKMPDAVIKKIVNYKTPTAKISDFTGKLLILDFWATYCAPCVAMFPRTDSLQKRFEGKLQFLNITKEKDKKVAGFLASMYKIKRIKPFSVVEDSLFCRYFSYATIPYYVWIGPNGKVLATTGSDEVNAKNIEAVLSGKPTAFVNRNDVRFKKLDINTSAFVLSNNFAMIDSTVKREEVKRKDIFSYSIATKSVDATKGQLRFDESHFAIMNVSTDLLYRYYYAAFYYGKPVQGAFDSNSSHVFDIEDRSLLNQITVLHDSIKGGTAEMQEWVKNHAVCYEIVYPAGLSWKEKGDMVKADLDRYFARPMGFKTAVERRIDSSTRVLRLIGQENKLRSAGAKPEEHHDRYAYSQQNMPLSQLISVLNGYFFQNKKTFCVDKTNYSGNLDLQINCDMTQIGSINEALKKYGLQFTMETTPIDVLVFSKAGK